jgi:guanyl-specific ribonuclease Sa
MGSEVDVVLVELEVALWIVEESAVIERSMVVKTVTATSTSVSVSGVSEMGLPDSSSADREADMMKASESHPCSVITVVP